MENETAQPQEAVVETDVAEVEDIKDESTDESLVSAEPTEETTPEPSGEVKEETKEPPAEQAFTQAQVDELIKAREGELNSARDQETNQLRDKVAQAELQKEWFDAVAWEQQQTMAENQAVMQGRMLEDEARQQQIRRQQEMPRLFNQWQQEKQQNQTRQQADQETNNKMRVVDAFEVSAEFDNVNYKDLLKDTTITNRDGMVRAALQIENKILKEKLRTKSVPAEEYDTPSSTSGQLDDAAFEREYSDGKRNTQADHDRFAKIMENF